MANDSDKHAKELNPYAAPRVGTAANSESRRASAKRRKFSAVVAFLIVTPVASGVALMILTPILSLLGVAIGNDDIQFILHPVATFGAIGVGLFLGFRTAIETKVGEDADAR